MSEMWVQVLSWKLSDLPKPGNIKVFSTFSCGGGSSMGYKKAGFDVIGNVEIDPRIAAIYQRNLSPRYSYTMDLREFNELDIPEELKNLDILDGSPPCSTFSMAGLREDVWGKEKVFREGQRKQILDDLFFVFLDTVEKLKPKIVIAENVEGIIKGNARGYVNAILKRFKELGYDVQLFKLNACDMEVPQHRVRVFFIANRENYPRLKLDFKYPRVQFKDVRSEHGIEVNGEIQRELLKHLTRNDKSMADISQRIRGKYANYNSKIVFDDDIASTVTSGGSFFRAYDKMRFSKQDFVEVSTFPEDYDFLGSSPQYICGMSVPPNMMYHIADEIKRQWLVK